MRLIAAYCSLLRLIAGDCDDGEHVAGDAGVHVQHARPLPQVDPRNGGCVSEREREGERAPDGEREERERERERVSE